MGETKGVSNTLIYALIAVVLIAALTPVIFGFLGTSGANALGNTTANPNSPTWLAGVMVILGAVGILMIFLKALKLV